MRKLIVFLTINLLVISVLGIDLKMETINRLNFATEQLYPLLSSSVKNMNIPRSTNPDGSIHWISESEEWNENQIGGVPFDWTEGFFPGSCLYLYEFSGNSSWLKGAIRLMALYEEHTSKSNTHDLGFVFMPSFGKAYELTSKTEYRDVVIKAANTLITRYHPTVRAIKSWDTHESWQKEKDWTFPVIIDNMMNLEMLFNVSKWTGDKKYHTIAVNHANTTMKHIFRDDYSSYHVLNFDTINGNIISKETAQGYAHESVWSRGQAWGLYGFTMTYRYTKDAKYLELAERIARFLLEHPSLPADKIPYWDLSASNIPGTYRDASAATIIASALLELYQYTHNDWHLKKATEILDSLSSPHYLAQLNSNNNFLLKHSVGSIPHNLEIDVPLNYADYYYVEALMRLFKLNPQKH